MPNKPFPIILLALGALWCLAAANTAYAGWSTPVRISEVGGGFYPQIIAQGDTLHVVYENIRYYDKIDYLRSSDGGATWSQHRVISQNPGHVMYPHIMRWSQRLLAAWRVYFSSGVYRLNIGYSISENNGLTWSIPQYALNPNWDYINSFGISLEDSTVNIVLYSDEGPENAFFGVRSTNFGTGWSMPRELFIVLEAGIPDQGNEDELIHFVWDGRFDLQHRAEIYYTRSRDEGIHWSPNIPLSDTDQYHSQLPSICINNEGRIAVTWMDYKYSPYIDTGDILLRISPDSGGSWNPEIQITSNHLATLSDITACGDTLYIAWEDHRGINGFESIYATRSTDNGINWDEPFWVDSDTNASWDPAIACSNGKAYLVWYDRQLPDSSGLYFSRYMPENDAINEGGNNNIPDKISLRAYPNPFNSSVLISIQAPSGGILSIYDLAGREIWKCELIDGVHDIRWEAKDKDGKGVASGTYMVRLHGNGGQSAQIKLVYLK